MTKKILLISDFSGYGKVAISAINPILVRHRFEVFSLPTMIVSNTLNYGKFASIDTTEYMKESISVWKELGFKFDAVLVGYISNDSQAELILNLCKEQKEGGAVIFADPIMGDNGKLYNSITQQRVDIMRRMISVADYIVPNMTEACYLADIPYREEGFLLNELYDIAEKLHKAGAKSVIITSALQKNGDNSILKAVVGYDYKNEDFFNEYYEEIPMKINGSGDTFSAFFMSEILNGVEVKTAVEKSVTAIRKLILENMDIVGEYNGLPIEASFNS